MLFDKKPKETKPKQPSTLGKLLNPEIGASIRPLGHSITMFVQLIGLLFAANGLFPRNHPGLAMGSTTRLTMHEIITTAYRELSFTPEGMPKVLLFFAVCGCLAFSALACLTGILVLLTGTAHAATANGNGGFFDAPQPDKDLSIGWINFLFEGKAMPTNDLQNNSGGQQATIIQGALITALNFYSKAILIFAGFILMYHLFSMIVETAQHGTPMGKRASQVWAPMRLVMALALLIPIGAGLNIGQSAMVQVAKWGCGLASQVWNTFVQSLTNGSGFVAPNAPMIGEVADNILMSYACMNAYNHELAVLKGANGLIDISQYIVTVTPGSTTYLGNLKEGAICGSYTKAPTNGNSLQSTGATANNSALDSYIQSNAFQTLTTEKINKYFPDCSAQGNDCSKASYPTPDDLAAAEGAYQSAISSAVQKANRQNDPSLTAAFQKISNSGQGWASAGAWFNTIARAQGNVLDLTSATLPVATGIDRNKLQSARVEEGSTVGAAKRVLVIMDQFRNDIHAQSYTNQTGAGAATNTPSLANTSATGIPQSDLGQSFGQAFSAPSLTSITDLARKIIGSIGDTVMTLVFGAVDGMASMVGVWNLTPTSDGLYIPLTGPNPLADLAAFGKRNMSLGFDLISLGVIVRSLSWAGGKATEQASTGIISEVPLVGEGERAAGGAAAGFMEKFGDDIGAIIVAIGAFFALIGITLAYYLPLIPFFHFFFGIINWVLLLIEAIVAMPLFALAHLTPYGEGILADAAKRGYFFAFSILLRPVLMVFGLMAGLLIFSVGIAFLNQMFAIATAGIGSQASTGLFAFITTYNPISKIIFTIIYAFLAYICANNCFKAIDHFPEHSINWMGGQGPQTKDLSDHGKLAQFGQLAAGYMTTRAVGAINKASGARKELAKESARTNAGNQQREEDLHSRGFATTRDRKGNVGLAYEKDDKGNMVPKRLPGFGENSSQMPAGGGGEPVSFGAPPVSSTPTQSGGDVGGPQVTASAPQTVTGPAQQTQDQKTQSQMQGNAANNTQAEGGEAARLAQEAAAGALKSEAGAAGHAARISGFNPAALQGDGPGARLSSQQLQADAVKMGSTPTVNDPTKKA